MDLDKLTPEEYSAYVEKKAPPSPLMKNMAWAFCVGGGICFLGQALTDFFRLRGLDTVMAGTATSVILIFLSALLTGLGVYDVIAKRAGAGTLVPITGFANSVVAPAMEFRHEGLVSGTSAKLFTVAGPVLAFGITASVIYGFILWLTRIF